MERNINHMNHTNSITGTKADQADLLKHCRYYTLGGPLRPSLFFLKNHRPGDIY